MRDGFVAKIGAHLDRVGRHLGADDAIAVSHGLFSDLRFLTAYRLLYLKNDLYHSMRHVRDNSRYWAERTRVANAPAKQARRCDDVSRPAGIARAGYIGDEFLSRRSRADGPAPHPSARCAVSPYRAASRPPGRARRRSS